MAILFVDTIVNVKRNTRECEQIGNHQVWLASLDGSVLV